jgi:hypothetical protein
VLGVLQSLSERHGKYLLQKDSIFGPSSSRPVVIPTKISCPPKLGVYSESFLFLKKKKREQRVSLTLLGFTGA